MEIVDFFRSQLSSRCNLNWESGVNTKSNLKSDVFREIALTLGLDYSHFETKENLIDETLLANRNRIAHGKYCLVGFADYLTLHDQMLKIMQDFYDQVENEAVTGAYKAT